MNTITRSKQHLNEAEESYVSHQRVAFRYGLRCFKAGLMAWVHGVVPSLFETRASEEVKRLAKGRSIDSDSA